MMNKKEDKSKVSRKYLLLFLFMMLWGLFIIAKMGIVMFGERQYWNEVSRNMTPDNKVIDARRGSILSDDGLLLASSMKQYRIFLDFKASGEKDQQKKDTLVTRHLAEFARQMHDIFPEYSVQEFATHYQKGHDAMSRSWVLLPGVSRNTYPISYNQYKSLLKTSWLIPRNEGWLYSVESKISRKKPFGSLATRTIGSMYESKDSAKNGLELSFDSLLRGVPGRGHMEKVQGLSRLVADVEQIDGCDIETTLNVEMQDFAEVALRRELEKVNAVSGVAILMEVATGDIKAIVSLNRTDDGYYEIQNNAVTELYEPGSTFKTVSMMVALDAGKISLKDSVYCEKGVYMGFGSRMTDSHASGTLSVSEVLEQSSNIGTAKLIHKSFKDNPEDFVDGIYRTGIGTQFDMQLIGTAAPRIARNAYWDNTRLPWMSFGYNVQLPAINTLVFYNAIANNGKMVAPRLVTRVVREGSTVESIPVNVVKEHICKTSTLKDVQGMLEQVVIKGTGKNAGSTHFQVAGKTGTAQLSQGGGGYRQNGVTYLASFCGYFPAENPQYSMIVTVRTSNGVGAGATLAGPVFHEISEKVMASHNLRDVHEAIDSTRQFIPTVLSGDLAKASLVLRDLGKRNLLGRDDRQVADSVWGSVSSDSGRYVMKRVEYAEGLVPDVRGMGASDALYLLEKMGFRVSMTGVGTVKRQSLNRNTRYRKGDRIQLTLSM